MTSASTTLTTSAEEVDMYTHFLANVEIFRDGDQVVLRTNGVPPHQSPYFGEGHPPYIAAYSGTVVNPNRIFEQAFEFRVPA